MAPPPPADRLEVLGVAWRVVKAKRPESKAPKRHIPSSMKSRPPRSAQPVATLCRPGVSSGARLYTLPARQGELAGRGGAHVAAARSPHAGV